MYKRQLLHGVELVALLEALDGCDIVALHLAGQRSAGWDGLALVEQHAARAALAVVAALLDAGESQLFAQHVGQRGVRLGGKGRCV